MFGDTTHGSDRGASAVVGFILMFGLVLTLLVVLQATAVPTWNQNAEYEHSLGTQDAMGEFRDHLLDVAARGGKRSASLQLGVVYPNRPFLLNPSNPSGTVRTLQPGTVTVSGAAATGETGDFWTGDSVSYTTRSLVYDADYHQYTNAPRYVVESTGYAADFGSFERNLGDPVLVDDRRISLVLVNGTLQRSGVQTESVTAHAVSAPHQTVTVRPQDGPMTVTVPTTLGETYWREALAEELVANGGHVLTLAFEAGEPYNRLTIRLEPGTSYDLAVAKVGVGTGREHDTPHYIVTGQGPRAMTTGTTDRFTFQVRDRYNNPVSGVDVSARVVSGPGSVSAVEGVTRTDGTAVFEYSASAPGTATIRASFGGGTTPLQTATFTVGVASAGEGEGGAVVAGGSTVGTGGTESYAPTSPTRTLSTAGGLWTGVTGVPRLLLSNPRFAPTEAGHHEQLQLDQRHFRLVYSVSTGSRTYYVAVTDPPEGLYYRPSTGAWGNLQVTILEERGGSTTAVSGTLDTGTLDRWRAGESMNLLSWHTYGPAASPAFRARLTEMKQALRNEQSDVYVSRLHGRVDMTASPTGRALAYPDVFVDGDGTVETQESTTIPPAARAGDVQNFFRAQQSSADDVALLVEQGRTGGMSVGTTTYGVDQSGSTYTLEFRFRYSRGGGMQGGSSDDATVRIVDEQGNTLQTTTLERRNANLHEQSVVLNDAAKAAVQDTGNLRVVYSLPSNRVETILELEYQRLRVT